MKIITATMAKNIANDFLNNACGIHIKNAMNKILLEAEKGHSETLMIVPSNWDKNTKDNVAMFFSGLGYEVAVFPTAILIRWQ